MPQYVYLNRDLTVRVREDGSLELRHGDRWFMITVVPPATEGEAPTIELTEVT